MFNDALPHILRFEGGYVNDPDDPGGATNKGVTQAVYDAHRRAKKQSLQPVRNISDDEVAEIYKRDYWDNAKCNEIVQTKPNTALIHFDSAVNCGVVQANKLLQRAIHTKIVDGIIGRQTLCDLSIYTDTQVCIALLREREQFYVRLVEKKPVLKKFIKSWMWRLRKLKQITLPPDIQNA